MGVSIRAVANTAFLLTLALGENLISEKNYCIRSWSKLTLFDSIRMCDMAAILGQFKNMFGGDYAAIADNLTRELMVIFMESPEARKTI